MASGYPGRGSAVHLPYHQQRSDGGGGLLKRSVTELEWQQQIQHALNHRSVKQRTSSSSSSSSSPSSLLSSSEISFNRGGQSWKLSDVSSVTELENKSTIKNQLQELERKLLLDDDDDDVSATGSEVTTTTMTTSEWSDAMQQLISPPPPQSDPLSPPTTSSTSSSSSSCLPTSSLTPSKQLLLETASLISEGNFDTAGVNLAVLKPAANPRGESEQRLTAMMAAALVSRVNPPPVAVTSPVADPCSLEHQTTTQMLYDAYPCFKLGLMAANFAVLDAMKDRSEIHVVDFDFGQGGQYASLISTLAERSRHRRSVSPPLLKITAVCDPTFPFTTPNTVKNVHVIGNKITTLAKRFGLAVRFNVVNRTASELNRTAIGCQPGEALAVNFAFVLSRIADESVSPANPRDELLRLVKSLEPTVVTMVEQEMNANTAPFVARFTEACNYYGSVLDSLNVILNRDSPDRFWIESCLACKAVNSIAREGADRVERPEVHGKWRARMSMAGFKPVVLGPEVCESVKLRFGSMKVNPGFMYKEEGGGIGFGWMGRVLTVASAWR